MSSRVAQLTPSDVRVLKALLKVFGEAFEDADAYGQAAPSDAYLESLLARPYFLVVVAIDGDNVIGGLAAYELEKFEPDRREIYIYDLAVSDHHRRNGVATQLIDELRRVATRRKASFIFVQADKGDIPAIRLYESLGTKQDERSRQRALVRCDIETGFFSGAWTAAVTGLPNLVRRSRRSWHLAG